MPIGEAMRLGIPVITTSWGGQRDFCNDSNCWLVDYEFCQSDSHFNLDLSYWADPVINDLIKKIKEVYYLSPSELSKKIREAKLVTNTFAVSINDGIFANNLIHCCTLQFRNVL